MALGESDGTVGSARSGLAAIVGGSLTLVIWMLTGPVFDKAPQRSTACTLKEALRVSEPLLTKRRPVVPASPVISDASMSVDPTTTLFQWPPPSVEYCRMPPAGAVSMTNFSALAPVASLLMA